MKTNCPTIEQVRKSNGTSMYELDKQEGIDKRLHAIYEKKAILERKKLMREHKILKERNKKLKRKSKNYSLVIRLVHERDIYFGEDPDGNLRYFFSYAILNNHHQIILSWVLLNTLLHILLRFIVWCKYNNNSFNP